MSKPGNVAADRSRNLIGEPMPTWPASADRDLRLRALEHQVQLLIAAVHVLADAVAERGETEHADQAHHLCDRCHG